MSAASEDEHAAPRAPASDRARPTSGSRAPGALGRLVARASRRAPAARGSLAALRTRHLAGQLGLRKDVIGFVRLHFLASAARAGILSALPGTREELQRDLGVANPSLLDALLRLGVALGELSESGGRFSLRGQRSRALASEQRAPLEAMLEEFAGYHTSVYRELPERLAGAELGDYLGPTATVVANSSRVVEPFMTSFVRTVVRRQRPRRMLEIGCGSGVYLRAAAEADPALGGIGIDMDAEVVAQAREGLRRWGLADRFEVIQADIADPPPELGGPFDLVTLYNNVYYFPVDDRPALFGQLRARLAAGGALALVSMMQGGSALAADLDLTLRSTAGAAPLPELEQLEAQLRESGFSHVERFKLMTTDPLFGVLAR